MTDDEYTKQYWIDHASQPPLPLLEKPCHDCAVTCGFYTPYADELLEQPLEIQEGAMKSWFCHNLGNRACRGVRDYIESKRKQTQE